MLPVHVKEALLPMIELLAQSSGGSSQGSPLVGLALPVLMLAGLYFVLIRPQRMRQRQHQALLSQLDVGDEVLTTGGIFGRIVEIDDQEGVLTVEVAPGTRIRMVRAGIAQRFVEDEDEASDEGADTEP